MASMQRVEAEKARVFAQNYVAFTEALQQQGVLEDDARQEAHMMAAMLLMEADAQMAGAEAGRCPLCGRDD